MMFLPQRPYMIAGSLREQMCYPRPGEAADEDLLAVLRLIGLDELPKRVGGFDAVARWDDVLSLGEQQQIAFARLLFNRPTYAFLDEATTALDPGREEALYRRLVSARIRIVSVGDRVRLARYHDAVLELLGNGDWRLTPLGTPVSGGVAASAAAGTGPGPSAG